MANKIINYLQTRSYQARGRMLAAVVAILVIGLGAVWVNGIKERLGGLTREDLLPEEQSGSVLSAVNYVSIEAYEDKGDKRYLHFKVENDTPDILSFSTREMITLEIGEEKINPESVINRQGQPFVVKVLSHETIYGTLIFRKFEGKKGELQMDGMFFEQNQGVIFRQTMEIDFQKLKPLQELRS
jgi:hypothetical protein